MFIYGDSYFDAPARAGFFNLFQAFSRARLYTNDLTEAFRHRQPGTRFAVVETITSGVDGMDNEIKLLIAALEADSNL